MQSSQAYLCVDVPLDSDMVNTISWTSATAQYNYFTGQRLSGFSNGTYIMDKGKAYISFPASADAVRHANYVMWQNPNYSSKWFYGFIDTIEWHSDKMCKVFVIEDHLQTWYFEMRLGTCLIEREHTPTDNPGDWLYPEGLESGEESLTLDDLVRFNELESSYCVVMGSTVDLTDSSFTAKVGGGVYNRVYSGCRYYAMDYDTATQVLKDMNEAGTVEALGAMFIFPTAFINNYPGSGIFEIPQDQQGISASIITKRFDPTPTCGSYTPRNKKLLTYPYCYIYASNNQGQANTYRYENFVENEAEIYSVTAACAISESAKPILIFTNYATETWDESITLPSFPMCSWSSDYYAVWLAQNGSSWTTNNALSLFNTGFGTLTSLGQFEDNGSLAVPGAGLISGLVNFSGKALSLSQQVDEKRLIPPTIGGTSGAGTTLLARGQNTFRVVRKAAKPEFLRRVDDYFDWFGYKTMRSAVPNFTSRPQHNFIKTVYCNLGGQMPDEANQTIKACFNNGIQFWKNPANVGNFGLDNSV